MWYMTNQVPIHPHSVLLAEEYEHDTHIAMSSLLNGLLF